MSLGWDGVKQMNQRINMHRRHCKKDKKKYITYKTRVQKVVYIIYVLCTFDTDRQSDIICALTVLNVCLKRIYSKNLKKNKILVESQIKI